jgi:hypothetical protein
VRTVLSTSIWNKLRKASYAKANNKCEICKGSGLDQGYKHAIECHEVWEYREDTQYLVKLQSLCVMCHQAKHIGRAIAMGYKGKIFKHMATINKWDLTTVEAYVGTCFQEHKERSKIKWKLNIRVLTEKYGVDKDLIEEGLRTKKNLKPTWKRKKKYKKKTSSRKVVAKRKVK